MLSEGAGADPAGSPDPLIGVPVLAACPASSPFASRRLRYIVTDGKGRRRATPWPGESAPAANPSAEGSPLPVHMDPRGFDAGGDPLRQEGGSDAPRRGGRCRRALREALGRLRERRRGHRPRLPRPSHPPTQEAAGIRRRLLAAAVLLFLLVAAFAAGEFVGLGKAVRQSPATTWSYRCPLGGTVAIVRDAAECAALRRFPGVYQPGGAFWYGVAVGAGATLAVLLECRRRRRT